MAKTFSRLSVTAAAVFLFLSGLPGCGGGGGSDPASVAKDTRAPAVTSLVARVLTTGQEISLMTSGAKGVPTSSVLIATVDEPTQCPDSQPVNGTFGTVAGSYTCVSGTPSVLTLVPTPPFVAGVGHTLTLSARDLAGNQVTLVTSFTTAASPPPPVSHAHGGVNLMMRNYTLHRVTTSGLLSNTNKTPWQFYAAVINLVPRADCLYRVSVLDNNDSGEHKVLYSMATGETFPDTSADGAALDRNQDYVYETVYDPTDHPEWRVKLYRPEGVYYSPNLESWALYFKGLDGAVIDLTPGAAQLVTGIVQGAWHIPACQVSAN